MRLLNTSTLIVEEFLQSRVPEYAILSHTWREEEVTLHDLHSGAAISKKGFAKLTGCCKKARDDGYSHCCIDTCCIDKSSSAELSEAINTMYQWYKGACICYAYLEDVKGNPGLDDYETFRKSRWFTRGWTLQELIAPPIVEFYNASWLDIGTRSSLQDRLMKITRISKDVLTGTYLFDYPVAVRMSWAALRETSRVEDQAYCLLGLFGVNMPLLYGEGERAFLRLQEEILRIDEDYTIFAWDSARPHGGLLAPSARGFENLMPALDMVPNELVVDSHIRFREHLTKTCFSSLPPPHDHLTPRSTSRGIHLTLPLRSSAGPSFYGLIALTQSLKGSALLLCIKLTQLEEGGNRYGKYGHLESTLALLPDGIINEFRYTSIYLNTPTLYPDQSARPSCRFDGFSIIRTMIDPDLLPGVTGVYSNMVSLRTFDRGLQHWFPLPPAYMSAGEKNTVELASIQSLPKITPAAAALIREYLPRYRENGSGCAPAIPELWFARYHHTQDTNVVDILRFQFTGGIAADLVIKLLTNPSLRLSAKFEPTLNLNSELRYLSPDVQTDASDRATVKVHVPIGGELLECCIKLSLRLAGSAAFAPGAKQYVLEVSKELSHIHIRS
jgi:hypothetical protein